MNVIKSLLKEGIFVMNNEIINQLEIKKTIDHNNSLIESFLNPNIFTLNNTVAQLISENRELQKKCNHVFDENGYCIY